MANFFEQFGPPGAAPAAPASDAPAGGNFFAQFDDGAKKPEFGSDAYIDDLAKKHGVAPYFVRDIVNRSTAAAAVYGIPVVGGLAEKYDSYIPAVAQPLTGSGAPGASVGERATKDKALFDEIRGDFEREHPHLDTASRLIGGTAATLATGGTAAGARLLGMGGKTIAQQIARGAVANAGISAADAAIRGEDVGTAATIGGVVGGAAPVVSRAIGSAVAPVVARLRPPKPPPVPPARILDVTLSEGQATRDLSKIQREQAAVRGTSGPPAQAAGQAFVDQQSGEVAATRDRLVRTLDPFNMRLAENPQQAGEIAQQGVQSAARTAKANVDAAYKTAREMPGEIHADTFRDMPNGIKHDLSLGDEPVIIDDKLTPHANQMINDIERRVGQLRIMNRAQPASTAMMPAGEDAQIVGVNLKGVDQMRKRLSTMRQDARGSGNAADARAANAVLDAFDSRIDAAVENGQFTGDQRAIQAWADARAAHSDYRSTFGNPRGRNDPVNAVVQKIIGRSGNPAAIPNDVADFLYGSAGTNPNSLNVAVVRRLQGVLGPDSPEWAAVRQGLFSRLVETGEGMRDMGPAMTAQRISKFLNADGREMANVLFNPSERALLTRYANLMRHLEVPQAGANWSNTATFSGREFTPSLSGRVLSAIGERVGMLVHGILGRTAGTAVEIATRHVSEANQQAREAREISRMMPVLQNVAANYARWARAAQRAPNSRNVSRLMLAAKNLSTNLGSIGITFSPNDLLAALQGPQPAQGRDTSQQPKQQ